MDRNLRGLYNMGSPGYVATREGGVDRNCFMGGNGWNRNRSPPARVAWIETIRVIGSRPGGVVATREGGVDRNDRYRCYNAL